jgi:hypothetical protein
MIQDILNKNGFVVLKANDSEEFDYLAFKNNSVLIIRSKKNLKINPNNISKYYKKDIDIFKDYLVPYNFIKEIWVETKQGYYSLDLAKNDDDWKEMM